MRVPTQAAWLRGAVLGLALVLVATSPAYAEESWEYVDLAWIQTTEPIPFDVEADSGCETTCSIIVTCGSWQNNGAAHSVSYSSTGKSCTKRWKVPQKKLCTLNSRCCTTCAGGATNCTTSVAGTKWHYRDDSRSSSENVSKSTGPTTCEKVRQKNLHRHCTPTTYSSACGSKTYRSYSGTHGGACH